MKKIAVTAMLLLIVCFSIFAQDVAETNSAAQEIAPSADISSDELNSTANNQIEVITEKDRLVTMVIEFIPYTDEARFIYSCPSGLFEQGKAMNYIKERAVKFPKERGYFFYTYTRPDMTRYDNENKIASYTSYIMFLH